MAIVADTGRQPEFHEARMVAVTPGDTRDVLEVIAKIVSVQADRVSGEGSGPHDDAAIIGDLRPEGKPKWGGLVEPREAWSGQHTSRAIVGSKDDVATIVDARTSDNGVILAFESESYDPGSNRLIVYGGCFWACSPALEGVFVLTNADGVGGTLTWSQGACFRRNSART